MNYSLKQKKKVEESKKKDNKIKLIKQGAKELKENSQDNIIMNNKESNKYIPNCDKKKKVL